MWVGYVTAQQRMRAAANGGESATGSLLQIVNRHPTRPRHRLQDREQRQGRPLSTSPTHYVHGNRLAVIAWELDPAGRTPRGESVYLLAPTTSIEDAVGADFGAETLRAPGIPRFHTPRDIRSIGTGEDRRGRPHRSVEAAKEDTMRRVFVPATWTIALSLFCLSVTAPPVTAHNGALAVAVPLEGITVDGDLSDWPAEGLMHYPVIRHERGSEPRDANDNEASFRVAYDRHASLILVSVEVKDESTVLDDGTSPEPYLAQDGCELFLDFGHGEGASKTSQFVVWGDTPRAFRDGMPVGGGRVPRRCPQGRDTAPIRVCRGMRAPGRHLAWAPTWCWHGTGCGGERSR